MFRSERFLSFFYFSRIPAYAGIITWLSLPGLTGQSSLSYFCHVAPRHPPGATPGDILSFKEQDFSSLCSYPEGHTSKMTLNYFLFFS